MSLLILLKPLTDKGFYEILASNLTLYRKNEVFMKNVKFLLALFTAAVLMASCATTESASGEDYDDLERSRRIGNRVYVDDPYYGTVVLERDPFTGRYYDVTYGYGGMYRSPYNTFNRGFRTYPRVYRNNGGGTIQQKPAPRSAPVNREAARKKILGN
jgi:hypothetical protein